MRKLVLFLFIILFGFAIHAQNPYISGGFNLGSDNYGNKYIYFQGTNISSYNLSLTVKCFMGREALLNLEN